MSTITIKNKKIILITIRTKIKSHNNINNNNNNVTLILLYHIHKNNNNKKKRCQEEVTSLVILNKEFIEVSNN
jgi:hypothetical protein